MKEQEKKIDKAVRLYKEGWRIVDIAKDMGVSRQCIDQYIKIRNTEKRPKEPKRTEKEEHEIIEQYRNGTPGTILSERYNLTKDELYRLRKKYGVRGTWKSANPIRKTARTKEVALIYKKEQSLRRAASRLGISVPAVQQHVQRYKKLQEMGYAEEDI